MKFLAQIRGIEIPHGNPRKLNTAGPVVSFERFPNETHRAHIIVCLKIQNGGNACFLPQPLNVIGSLRM
jgi:hypothetical protein